MPPVPARIARAISPARVSMHRPRVAVTLCVAALLSACGADAPTPDAGTLVVRDSLVAGDSIPVRVIESTDAVADERAAPFVVDTAPELVIGTDAGEEPYELHRVFDAMQWRDGRNCRGEQRLAGAAPVRQCGRVSRQSRTKGRGTGGVLGVLESEPVRLARLAARADDGRAHVYSPTLEFVSTRPFDVSSGPSRRFCAGYSPMGRGPRSRPRAAAS
jgi:hypothetical protein